MRLYSRFFCKRPPQSLFIYLSRHKSTVRPIDKLLIANRGEIACRVIRTANKLGIKTVAVYSDTDIHSLHVALASEAYAIGPSPAAQSYLRGDKILEVAKLSGSQAIHPGYGFLSENVEFAEQCQKEGVIYVGPPPSAIRDMGIKSTSKHIMAQAGVPIIEGYHGENQDNENLRNQARKIGFPIMIKAVRGGGGKGMRIVHREDDFEEALDSARTEAQKAFGDSVVLLEKFVEEPRHVEVQVFADAHGNAVYLYERDCSVQRRHQKIIEEAPAPGLSSELRRELGTAAVRAAKAVGYVGAGTVEFILDKKTLNFHFMEMNTRLQVEHPITEMITGTDLVEWQLKVAAGEELPLKQEDIPLNGHSFEARVYAEDPRGGFLPGAGQLLYMSTPTLSEDVRLETGVKQGDEVSVHYDPMIAKLVVWGPNRSRALAVLKSKLLEFNIAGLETNINFLLELADHPEFQAGRVHTNFIRDHRSSLFPEDAPSEADLIRAALSTVLWDRQDEARAADQINDSFNPFILESNFRLNHRRTRDVKLRFKEIEYCIKVRFTSSNDRFDVSCDSGSSWSQVYATLNTFRNKNLLTCVLDGHSTVLNTYKNDQFVALFTEKGKVQLGLPTSTFDLEEDLTLGGDSKKAVAPMPGVLDKILVKVGDSVAKGDPLFVLIAMKMEHIVKAASDAQVASIPFKIGDNVLKDATVVQFV